MGSPIADDITPLALDTMSPIQHFVGILVGMRVLWNLRGSLNSVIVAS